MRHLHEDEFGMFWWGWDDVWIDRFGNEVAADEVPFIRDGNFIAIYFQLFDLNYDGIPEILITFIFTTAHRSVIFRFIDGQYREVGCDIGNFWFFYDQDGIMHTFTAASVFYYLCFDSDDACFEVTDGPADWTGLPARADGRINWEAHGFIEIPPLTDLAEDIRKSITARFFAEMCD